MQIAGTLFDSALIAGGSTPNTPQNITAATYALSLPESLARVDCTANSITITMPLSTSLPRGTQYVVKRVDSSANTLTVTATGSDVIDGAATVSLVTPYSSITLSSYAGGWDII